MRKKNLLVTVEFGDGEPHLRFSTPTGALITQRCKKGGKPEQEWIVALFAGLHPVALVVRGVTGNGDT
jgi:hypothetical protein